MCYLCLQDNPFNIQDLSKEKIDIKRNRAKLVKELLEFYYKEVVCDDGKLEIIKLKEEQYKLSREM